MRKEFQDGFKQLETFIWKTRKQDRKLREQERKENMEFWTKSLIEERRPSERSLDEERRLRENSLKELQQTLEHNQIEMNKALQEERDLRRADRREDIELRKHTEETLLSFERQTRRWVVATLSTLVFAVLAAAMGIGTQYFLSG